MNDKNKFDNLIWSVISCVGALLLGGDIYFIKRTLDRLDSIESIAYQLKVDVAILNSRLSANFAAPQTRNPPPHPSNLK